MKRKRAAALILPLMMTAPALCEDHSAWSNLERLKQGERIGIIQADQKRIEGRFVQVTDSAVTLNTDRDIPVGKENVIRVYRRPRVRRIMRILVGAGIGIGAGALLSSTVGDRFRNEGQDVSTGLWIGGAASIGAGLGALSGGGYQTVFQRSTGP